MDLSRLMTLYKMFLSYLTTAVLHNGSHPSQSVFFKMRFRVCTALSLCPFDCGKLGVEVVSLIPQSLPKLVNSWLANGV